MESKKETTHIFSNLFRAIRLMWKVDKKYIFILLSSTIIVSLFPASSLIIMQNIINQIQIASASFKTIITEIIIYVLIDLTQTLISTQVAFYTTKFNLAFNLKIKESILQKAAGLTLKDFENSEMYNRIRRAQNESEGKLPAYVSLFIQIIGTTISMITYLAFLILFKPWIVAIVLLVPAVKYFVLHKINIKQFKILKERTNKERKAWYYSYLITNGQNFKELKLYNLFQYFNDLYKKLKKHFNEQDYKIAKESTVKISIFTIFEQVFRWVNVCLHYI